jgi:hypothetical protein
MSNKDLVIGAASNYDWNQLKIWVKSLKKTGFSGDIAIVGTNIKIETIEKLRQEGVILSLYGKQNENGDVVSPTNNNVPHVERFFYIWNFLNSTREEYENIITTDTRDVLFQSNPSEWLKKNVTSGLIVASSEGIRYKNEPWSNKNLLETFGPFFHNKLKDKFIFNVGVIAGDFEYVKGLMLMIFQMSINRLIPIVDQAVYNFILNTAPYVNDTFFTKCSDSWAINLGTTFESVKCGSGDLGLNFKNNIDEYVKLFEEDQPIIDDGIIKNSKNEEYCIVHQYDRVKKLNDEIQKMYEEY